MPTIRHAQPDDAAAISNTLTEAFTSDPLQIYLMPDPDNEGRARISSLRRFMDAERDSHLLHGHSYLADEGDAVALWEPPGVLAGSEQLLEVFSEEVDESIAAEAAEPFALMFTARPETPHFYLAILGAADRARGQGLGAALLKRVLSVCDDEGWDAHLESTNGRNVSLYERHGFVVTQEIEFAPGVIVRPMTRQPNPSA